MMNRHFTDKLLGALLAAICGFLVFSYGSMDENDSEKTEKNLLTPQHEDSLRQIFTVLSKSNDADFIADFFQCLFTPSELKDIATRWVLVQKLDEGIPQRQIAKELHVSLCRITRGSKELKKDSSAFRRLLDKIKQGL